MKELLYIVALNEVLNFWSCNVIGG